MSDVKLGVMPDGNAKTDAIHVAVAPVVAAMDLNPGDHVALVNNKAVRGMPNPVGVVDPFRSETIKHGEKFWLCLYPGTVTGMRHHWSHPAFNVEEATKVKQAPTDAEYNEAKTWLMVFCSEWGMDYREMVQIASTGNDYFYASGRDLHDKEDLGDDYDKLWECLEIVTGKKYDAIHRDSVRFSCSC